MKYPVRRRIRNPGRRPLIKYQRIKGGAKSSSNVRRFPSIIERVPTRTIPAIAGKRIAERCLHQATENKISDAGAARTRP
jgi:hypothetical protein